MKVLNSLCLLFVGSALAIGLFRIFSRQPENIAKFINLSYLHYYSENGIKGDEGYGSQRINLNFIPNLARLLFTTIYTTKSEVNKNSEPIINDQSSTLDGRNGWLGTSWLNLLIPSN